ncbi:hypothetical protein Bhyg_08841 [Pseudolycoriella hygida]|uniref:RING-type domain-containing protein n=1 Tax=Pseudolycoriella hygida TaxID=35572 RepID=A0A9Q0N5F1_9DIPT|nr:hypothetical protein Bhyg_08841 [Pseudolycoriella hygida]
METRRFKHDTYLYPHDTDNFILIVPRRYQSKMDYNQILKSPLISVWAPTVAIVAVTRFIFNKIRKINKKLVDISLETFGLSLGISFNAGISSLAENLLLWCFCLGTMLSGMLLSSSMFLGFALQLDILTINNLKELEMSGLTVQVPNNSESIEYFFDNIPQKLKLTYAMPYEISDMIQSKNTSYAYAIREGKFNILFSNDRDIWHIIERFGHEHLSFKLRKFAAIEDRMNTVVQRCVNHGLVKYLVEKNKRLLTEVKPGEQNNDREGISSNVEPLSLSDMRNFFLLGALGLITNEMTNCHTCSKTFSRTRSICSHIFHLNCGNINIILLNEIEQGNTEWKCPDCRKRSTRRSTIMTDQNNHKNGSTQANNSSEKKTKAKSVAKASYTTSENQNQNQISNDISLEASLSHMVNQLNSLQEGQNTSNRAIQEVNAQMGVIQTISNSLVVHDTRLKKLENTSIGIRFEMNTLNRRMNELEQLGNNRIIQINGVPLLPDENLELIITAIGDKIGMLRHSYNISLTKRCSSHLQASSSVTDNQGAAITDNNVQPQSLITPIHTTFDSLDQKNSFLMAFRKERRKVKERSKSKGRKLFIAAAVDLNSEQVRYNKYMETLHIKDNIYLYPHDTDNFILIVPKRFKSKIDYGQILKSPLILVWAPLVAIVAVTRFIFNKIKKTDKNLFLISLETFGLSLGMSFDAPISSAGENFLLWCFCLGTMLSGMLLSSSMFQGFALQLEILTINNLKELEMAGLEVQVPKYSESVEYFFDNISQKLKLSYILPYEISDMIESRNTNYAYVIRESKFNVLFSNHKDHWHVIDRFGYEHLSFKLHFFAIIEDRLNTLIQRCVNHGIVKYLVEKNKRLLTGIKAGEQNNDKQMISSNVEPLSFSDVRNSFLLGALGLVFSAVAFFAEKIYFAKRCFRRKPITINAIRS